MTAQGHHTYVCYDLWVVYRNGIIMHYNDVIMSAMASQINRLFRSRSQETSKLRVTGLYEGNSPVTGEFPAHKASNVENISIWWRHHGEYTV